MGQVRNILYVLDTRYKQYYKAILVKCIYPHMNGLPAKEGSVSFNWATKMGFTLFIYTIFVELPDGGVCLFVYQDRLKTEVFKRIHEHP